MCSPRAYTDDWFVLVRLVENNSKAELTLEDDNAGIRAQQEISYTNFPLAERIIYACRDKPVRNFVYQTYHVTKEHVEGIPNFV